MAYGKNRVDVKKVSRGTRETTLETNTVPAVGDAIIVDKDCISARDGAGCGKTPSIRFSNGRTKKMMRL